MLKPMYNIYYFEPHFKLNVQYEMSTQNTPKIADPSLDNSWVNYYVLRVIPSTAQSKGYMGPDFSILLTCI